MIVNVRKQMKDLPIPHQSAGDTVESCKVVFHKILQRMDVFIQKHAWLDYNIYIFISILKIKTLVDRGRPEQQIVLLPRS